MVYHSKISAEGFPSVCDCPILPLAAEGQTDIVDEAILYFRANVLFRSFKILSSSDKLLIYLTLFISQCLQRITQADATPVQAKKLLFSLANESFLIPGQADFPLGGLFSPPENKDQEDEIKEYMKQVREAAGMRLVAQCYRLDGKVCKHWAVFACRRFLGKSLT